jgi:preprotein translocase subunit SecG
VPRRATVAAVIDILLVVFHSIFSVLLVFAVLLHSGRDAGLSGAFGVGGGASSYGGSSAVVERNLDRITVVIAVLFFCTTIALSLRI